MEKKYECRKCGQKLGSSGWLTRHIETEHPYVPPEPPRRTVEVMDGGETMTHKLRRGVGVVRIGDSINIDTKYIVRRTTETEGNTMLEVEVEKVTGFWTKN